MNITLAASTVAIVCLGACSSPLAVLPTMPSSSVPLASAPRAVVVLDGQAVLSPAPVEPAVPTPITPKPAPSEPPPPPKPTYAPCSMDASGIHCTAPQPSPEPQHCQLDGSGPMRCDGTMPPPPPPSCTLDASGVHCPADSGSPR